ncbi:SAM-dependent methyltransferase [Nocardiopsis ansamitocini]|uniref:S-adenosyl-L-methionine-dependent methyltransferase n=1 Tax=Nocardiopsis ansamitocini TaxID=1670832 RepID=A0A9W6UIY1_9ACTN|nr:SAM-dependent methyltransferase [Nocardiopsis ansamitocini]GLU48167.1 S-adenosyl-L-methionine-dependent methyltransferase [Nocardiopsis ansamitocini]
MVLEHERLPTIADESWTALGNVAARAEETRRPAGLFSDPLAERFSAALAAPGQRDDRRKAETWSGDLLDMIADTIIIKTRFLDEFLEQASAAGCRQTVLLAAGLDTRAFRLPWPPGQRVFELDLPGLLDFKEAVLADAGARPTCERTVVRADLRDDWPGALLAAGFDPRRPTVWLAEGTLGFLTEEACDELMTELGRLSAPGSRLGLDHTHDGEVHTDRVRPFVEQAGFHMADMVKGGPTLPADQWLTGHGWQVEGHDIVERAAAYGRPTPYLFRGERSAHGRIFFTAERG